MSYCRWSSLNGYCDVYVFEDVHGGWTTHVASRRPPPGAPEDPMEVLTVEAAADPELWTKAWAEFQRRQAARDAWASTNASLPIEHPEAGASFNHPTPGDCADNLERLRAEGFIVPQAAIDVLRSESLEVQQHG